MTEQKRNNNKLWITLAIVVFILTIIGSLVAFDQWVEGKIENHRDIVELKSEVKWSKQNVEDKLEALTKEVQRQATLIENLDKKLDKLLADEYGP